MRELALFAGGGGGLLASEMLGWDTVCAVESDPHARAVLRDRWPALHIHHDIRSFVGHLWYTGVDVVSGGFPCQAHSHAARGRNTAVDLWPEMLRVVREVEPKYVFAENVQRKPIQNAAEDLARLGYVVRCAQVSAADVGAPHQRSRYWLVAADPDHEGQRPIPLDEKVAGACLAARLEWSKPPPGRVLGVDDGLAGRTHRMRIVGNGQVPQAAVLAWVTLSRGIVP